MSSIGLSQSASIPQLFTHTDKQGHVDLVVIKIVDDMLATGTVDALKCFIKSFDRVFTLGEIVHGPERMRFFGLNLVQNEDFSCSIDGDEKLTAIEALPLSRVRRRQCDEPLNPIEQSAFMSVNASIGWLGITSSVLCAFQSSHLQQRLRCARVSALMTQASALKFLNRHGTLTTYICPSEESRRQVTLIAFADASYSDTASQLCHVVALAYGKIAQGSLLHLLSWASHRSRRPVRSTAAAETLAAGEALDEIVCIRDTLAHLLIVNVSLAVLVNSKDLYSSLSSQRHPIDKSVHGDVNCIRYHYETSVDLFGWIRGMSNPADVGTKNNSQLVKSYVLTSATGVIQFDLESMEVASKHRSLR